MKFGLLTIPVPEPEDDNDPISDPALRMLLDFLTGVLNYDLGDAWKIVAPADETPVVRGYAENPDLENLDVNTLPALFGWRSGRKDPTGRYSQDFIASNMGFDFLWVPPPPAREDSRVRQPIINGIEKSVQSALALGRHKGWIVPGDTYYGAQQRGSVLLRHLKVSRVWLDEVRPHLLKVETSEDGKQTQNFDCVFFTIDALELAQPGLGDNGVPHVANEGTIRLGNDPENRLEMLRYHAGATVTSITPPTGEPGTLVTVRGTQFFPTMQVLFDGVAGLDLVVVDDTIATLRLPLSSGPGTVDVTIRGAGLPDAVSADAFVFTS